MDETQRAIEQDFFDFQQLVQSAQRSGSTRREAGHVATV